MNIEKIEDIKIDFNDYWDICSNYYQSLDPPIEKSFLEQRYNLIKDKKDSMDGKLWYKQLKRHVYYLYWEIYLNIKYNIPFIKDEKKEKNKKQTLDFFKSEIGWNLTEKDININYLYNGCIVCVSINPKTEQIVYLLAKDGSVFMKETKMRFMEKGINLNEENEELDIIKNSYFEEKWGLIGGRKSNKIFENIKKTTAREFVEESMGLVLGKDITKLQKILYEKKYQEMYILEEKSQNRRQRIIYIKQIPFIDNIEELSNKMFSKLLSLRICSLLIKDKNIEEKIKNKTCEYAKGILNELGDHPAIILDNENNFTIKKDYLEKKKLKWWSINQIKSKKEKMKKEVSIIEFVHTRIKKKYLDI